MRKPRINAHISHNVAKHLSNAVAQPGRSKAAIVDAALAAFLDPDSNGRSEAAILRRLDRIDRQLDRLEQDITIVSETIALFVRYSLTVAPPASDLDHATAQAKGRERFEQFMERVARRIISGRRVAKEILGNTKAP